MLYFKQAICILLIYLLFVCMFEPFGFSEQLDYIINLFCYLDCV